MLKYTLNSTALVIDTALTAQLHTQAACCVLQQPLVLFAGNDRMPINFFAPCK